jgi:hypothetical protein|tara:strand:- start:1080 stop:1268 length:189 start_codon:yes stop_codon:yes gene_type:complete
MTEQSLSENDVNMLRSKGLLREGETAVSVGNMLLAVDLVTKERRVIQAAGLMLESTRKLLKD